MKTARKKPRPPKTATGMAGAGPDRPFPSREQIRAFLAETPGRVGKREAMRAFGLGPEQRVAMRTVLKEMAARGEAAPAGHKRFTAPHGAPRLTGSLGRSAGGRLPEAIIVEITGIDSEGDAIARPAEWRGDGPAPTIFMQPEARGQAALAPGQRPHQADRRGARRPQVRGPHPAADRGHARPRHRHLSQAGRPHPH
jgi:ribonuclease R